ncbi:MAG: PAS domain-containing protein [Candidatus Krumholzibacteriia bacterium]
MNASRRTLEIYGLADVDEVHFSDAQKQVLAEDRPLMDRAMADLLAHRSSYDVQFRIRRRGDHAVRHLRSIARYDAERHIVFGVLIDITDVAEATAELARREAQLRAIFDSVGELIFLKDRQLRYTHINRAALNFLGLAADDVIGKTDDELFSPDQAADILASDRVVLAGIPEQQRVVRESGGRQAILETVKVPVCNADGEVVGLCGVSRDITELRRLEDQLRQSQKLEAIGRLAGGIAHDINNLLTPILGYAELLRETLANDPVASRELQAIERAGLRARDLTANLLAFSRKQVLDRRVVSLNDIIAESRDMLRRLLRENIQVRYLTADDLGAIRADRSQMHNVLINLAVNAADAMPDGGLLTVETQNVDLDDVYAETHPEAVVGPYVLFAVTDTGCGMDGETRRRAFEPFFTTKPVDEGTGLGLATVHGIVTQHGGTIELYSEPGHGATFKIYLPRVAAAADAAADDADPAELSGNESILVVEDDDAVRRLAAAVLERYGYQVTAVASPSIAIAHAAGRDEPYDLLLSDVVMPGMNGAQLHRALRGFWPDLPVLYMSGYTSNVIAHHGVLAEGLQFIQKPFHSLDLVRRIRDLLDL